MFLCEGTHLLQEAIATHWPIEAVCFTEPWARKHPRLIESLFPKTRRQLVTQQVLNHLATTEHPDGVIAIARFRGSLSLKSSLTLGLGVETLQEPGNLGSLIRASVATAADGIWLSPDSVDPVHPKVLRASAGQWFRQSIVATPLQPWIEKCRSQKCQILAAASGGRSYWDFDFTKPTLFLLGNEGAGLTKSIMQMADEVVSIPMAPGVESLNVGTTGALLLYEAMRQRNRAVTVRR
jgi:TrmH family RNA methyltransferase